VFRRVGFGLSRVPLEHLFSIYGMRMQSGAENRFPAPPKCVVKNCGGAGTQGPPRQREIIDRVGVQLDAARHVVRPYFR